AGSVSDRRTPVADAPGSPLQSAVVRRSGMPYNPQDLQSERGRVMHSADGSRSGPAETARGAWWALAALCAMNLLNYTDRFILAAVLKPVQEGLDIKEEKAAGYLGMAFLVSYSLLSPVTGWLGDRMRRTHLLAIGVGTWSVATFASGLAGWLGLSGFWGQAGGGWAIVPCPRRRAVRE